MNRIGIPALGPAATAANTIVRGTTERPPESATSPGALPQAGAAQPQAIVNAVQQTVQALGMNQPPAQESAPARPTPEPGADVLGPFVQALFQAVHEQDLAPAAAQDSVQASLPASLDRLSLQAAQGLAPSALQAAFVELKRELQTRLPRDSATAFDPNNPPSLQQFLEALRHNRGILGSHFPSIGNMLRIRA